MSLPQLHHGDTLNVDDKEIAVTVTPCEQASRVHSHQRFIRRKLSHVLFSPCNHEKWVNNPLLNFSIQAEVDQIASVNPPTWLAITKPALMITSELVQAVFSLRYRCRLRKRFHRLCEQTLEYIVSQVRH